MRRVLAGETALFEALMRRYNQRLYRVARVILKDDSEAEDVMQHAYVQAYTHLGQFAGRSSFATWLTRIAVHEALARARRRRRDVPTHPLAEPGEEAMLTLKSEDPNPEQLVLQGELCALLESSIEGLPVAYRSVLVLREVEGLTPPRRQTAWRSPRTPSRRGSTARGPCCGRSCSSAPASRPRRRSHSTCLAAIASSRPSSSASTPAGRPRFTENAASIDVLARTVECR